VQQVIDYFPAKSMIGTSFVDALTVISGPRRVDQLIRLPTRLSSTDSASSVRLGVSGEHRPLRTPHCKSACKRWRSAAEAKPEHELTAYRSLPIIIEL